jgi:hypothetical protein
VITARAGAGELDSRTVNDQSVFELQLSGGSATEGGLAMAIEGVEEYG